MSIKKPQPQRGKQHDQVERDERETKASATASRSAGTLIVIAIALILAVVVIVLTGKEIGREIGERDGFAESQNGPRITSPREAVSIANSLLAGIPQHGNALGMPTAPVTLEVFAGFECLPCREFAWWGLRYLIETWVVTGKLRIEYHPLFSARNSFAVFREQQAAALAAGAQNKMWNLIEISYFEEPDEGKGELPSNYVQSIAAQVPGLNLLQWDDDRSNTSLTSAIIRDVRFAAEHHFSRTGALLLGKTGGPLSEIEFRNEAKFNNAMRELLDT